MNTYKHWRGTAVDAPSQEHDRPRHKPFTSLSRHKTPEIRAAARDKEDSKRRSARGYVSDGPLPSSQTPVPTYPTGAQSLATASKASHYGPTPSSQGHSAYVLQKAPLQNTPSQQESYPTTQRYSEAAPDPRSTPYRTVPVPDKAPSMSPDSTRNAEDHHKSSRHRHRQHPTPAPEGVETQAAPTSTWPHPASFFKKVSPEGREKEKEQSRKKSKEESKANFKAKDKGRTERAQEHGFRDQREWDLRYEEERRHYKDERRREKEKRREEEQRHDEKRHEQKVREDYAHKSTRDQERRRDPRDSHVPVTSVGKDPRLIRVTVKDSDESDNSLMKPSGSTRPRRHHPKDQTTSTVVPTVLRQPTYPATLSPAPIAQPENNTASTLNESRRAATLVQPSQATSGASTSNEKSVMRPQRASPRQNPTVPYPPGYAVSASDSEHVSRREHRMKIAETARSIERPRTSGGHRASVAHDVVSKPSVTQPVQPPPNKSPPRSEVRNALDTSKGYMNSTPSQKLSKGGFGAWVFHRDQSNSHTKPGDAHISNQMSTQPNGHAVPVPPLSARNDTPEVIPQVVSIRAGEGPADIGVRHATPPAVNAFATDAAARQPLPTVQVLQQPQSSDKQPRDAPRVVAATQFDPPGHAATTHTPPLQPWVEPTRWSTEPRVQSPVSRPPVVPSPVVFPSSLAAPPTLMNTQQHITPPRAVPIAPSSHRESHIYTREGPWHNPTNGRPLAQPVHSHTVPSPATGSGQRSSPQGASPVVHDVIGSKHSRYSSMPAGYTSVQPSYVTSPSRPIAPDLAAAFPIQEDTADAYRHLPQGERPRETQPPKDTLDHWDRHGHNQDNIARMILGTAPSSERTPRSAKASPSLYPRTVNQGTPPKPPLQSLGTHPFPQQTPTNPDVQHAHDSSLPGVYNMPNQNSNSSPYPAASVYPSPSPRTKVEANSAINNPPIVNASWNNPPPIAKSGNPSPRSRSQVVAPSQGPTPPVAVHITTRTPSHETGSTTLQGHTSSSQGSVSMQLPRSPQAHPQTIVSRATTHGGQQIAHPSIPVSDNLGDRNANIMSHTQVPPARQTSARHYHSHSAPVVSVSSLAQTQPPPDRSQTQPLPRVPPPVSPTPVRSYHPTTQTIGDAQIVRMPDPGYSSTPAPNPRHPRSALPSPSQESELNTPSSLAVSTKLPIVSDEPLAPVMSSQSYQEPKKKGGFFQGLFRSRSSAQKRHPHESRPHDHRVTTTMTTTTTTTTTVTATKVASSKFPPALHYDTDSKVGTTPSRLKKSKPAYNPVTHAVPQPPQPPVTSVPVPAPSFTAAMEETFSSAPNAFATATIRIASKRYRTMSGASAEAVDGTNAGASTVLTSPANSTRSPTPKLLPPQRDPQQAIHAWRNREEAEAVQRGNARRRRPRPGVHFEGYEDHPQAEHHRFNYATRAREKVRS